MNKKAILILLAMLPFIAFAQQKENDPTEGEPFVKRTTAD